MFRPIWPPSGVKSYIEIALKTAAVYTAQAGQKYQEKTPNIPVNYTSKARSRKTQMKECSSF
jgi:hypothetical protein